MPLQRRLPKRGFHNPFRVEYSIVNLGQLDGGFEAGAVVDARSVARPRAGAERPTRSRCLPMAR